MTTVDLDEVSETVDEQVEPPKRRRWPVLSTAVVLAAALTVALLIVLPGHDPAPSAQPARTQALTFQLGGNIAEADLTWADAHGVLHHDMDQQTHQAAWVTLHVVAAVGGAQCMILSGSTILAQDHGQAGDEMLCQWPS